MRPQAQPLRDRAAIVQGRDELADAVDQDVAVKDRGQALRAWPDLSPTVAVLVAPNLEVGLLREREDGVLHRGAVALDGRIEHVAHEEVRLMPDGRRGDLSFVLSPTEGVSFVLSPTIGKVFVFSPTSVNSLRVFTHRSPVDNFAWSRPA
jgi:hypothetical protein